MAKLNYAVAARKRNLRKLSAQVKHEADVNESVSLSDALLNVHIKPARPTRIRVRSQRRTLARLQAQYIASQRWLLSRLREDDRFYYASWCERHILQDRCRGTVVFTLADGRVTQPETIRRALARAKRSLDKDGPSYSARFTLPKGTMHGLVDYVLSEYPEILG